MKMEAMNIEGTRIRVRFGIVAPELTGCEIVYTDGQIFQRDHEFQCDMSSGDIYGYVDIGGQRWALGCTGPQECEGEGGIHERIDEYSQHYRHRQGLHKGANRCFTCSLCYNRAKAQQAMDKILELREYADRIKDLLPDTLMVPSHQQLPDSEEMQAYRRRLDHIKSQVHKYGDQELRDALKRRDDGFPPIDCSDPTKSREERLQQCAVMQDLLRGNNPRNHQMEQ
jgi:hypothetical protein